MHKKAWQPVKIDWHQFCTLKPKSVPGFEPGLPRQNAIAIPLVPPPLPQFGDQANWWHIWCWFPGPSHKKSFTVCLKLGDAEEYLATGPSIKKAQHAAAAMAIEKTKLKHPAPKMRTNTKLGQYLMSCGLLCLGLTVKLGGFPGKRLLLHQGKYLHQLNFLSVTNFDSSCLSMVLYWIQI